MEDDYFARVVAARAPEVADQYVSFEVIERVIEVIDALSEKIAQLSVLAGAAPLATDGQLGPEGYGDTRAA